MKRPKSEYVPNQGCGSFYLMVLSVFLLISIPIVTFTYQFVKYSFEEQILFTSDSPDGTYHIEISSEGPSTRILIVEETTASELIADIVIEGRDDAENFFCSNAEAKDLKIEKWKVEATRRQFTFESSTQDILSISSE